MAGRKRADKKKRNWLLLGLIVASGAIHAGLFCHLSGIFTVKQWSRLEITLLDNLPKASQRAAAKLCDRQSLVQAPGRIQRLACASANNSKMALLEVDPVPRDGGAPAEIVSLPIVEYSQEGAERAETAFGGEESNIYLALVRSRIERQKRYPPSARAKSLEGAVVIRFVILNDGSVRSLRVVQSSGSGILDEAGLKAIHRAAPFPKPPVNVFGSEVPIELPIVFKFT